MPLEFDCCECRRRVIDFGRSLGADMKLCAHCVWLPGWFRSPEFRAIVDPDHDGQEAGALLAAPPDEPRSSRE